MGFVGQVKDVLRALLTRVALVAAGFGMVLLTARINAGPEILAGLLAPESSGDIAYSVARLMAPVIGLWLIYRGLR